MRYALLLAVLLLVACGEQAKSDPWRADAQQLLTRTERLAEAGDVAAAMGTLAELENRDDPALKDRGRAAVARAMLKAGRTDEAQQLLLRVPWADKSPAVAGELVSLDLAIRWRGLFSGERLASGMIPAVEAGDSDHGEAGGAWEARRMAWHNWQQLLTGGVRMAEREGAQVAMPGGPGLLALARWAHGAIPWSEVAPALAGDAAAQLAAVHLHLAEHDPASALREAETLWLAEATGSAEAYTALRLWQLRRRLIGSKLTLWPFPAVEARLDALAGRFAAADAAARSDLATENDLGDIALREALRKAVPMEVKSIEAESPNIDLPSSAIEERPKVWKLALSHDGLSLGFAESVVAVGAPVLVRLRSDYAGPHRLEFWRIADQATWERLVRKPRREDLPERPDLVRELERLDGGIAIEGMGEGRWVAAVSARACPVVVLGSVRVAATALHVQCGVDGLIAWTVGRGDGRGVATPLRVAWELERDVALAGGLAWKDATPAWRSGFGEAFLGRTDPAFVSTGAIAEVAAGRLAGAAAAAADPAFTLEQPAVTAADGILRLALPPALAGRAYTVRVTIDRPSASETTEASWSLRASWAVRAVCWADKPLVRPGETLRFAGLVRENDGEAWRRPERSCAGAVRVGGETVWQGVITLDGRGMLAGAVPVPAGAAPGKVELLLDGVSHGIARCDRLALPAAVLRITCPDGASQLAGETRNLRVRAEDASGAPLAATRLRVRLSAVAREGGDLPVEVPDEVTTDLAGEAAVAIPTAADREASWVVTISVRRDGAEWGEHHAWSTTRFPFPIEADPLEDEVEAGGVLRLRLRLPAGASVRLQAARGDTRVGQTWNAIGRTDGTAEAMLALAEEHSGADALLLIADLPGGGEALRRLPVRIVRPPQPGQGESVACLPASTRVRTGDNLAVTVGTAASGRDVLLLAGTGALIHHATVHVPAATAVLTCAVTPAWSPEVHLQAVAWMPGSRFITSRQTTVRVLPVDRLLRVTLAPDRAEPRPGETVRVRISVRDWQDRPVAGAGLTLGAVDQRLYALAEDTTPDLWRFFHDHRRPWRLVDGRAVADGQVYGQLWRSVIWRWQPDDEEELSGGGVFSSRGSARCGGAGRYVSRITPSLGTEADPTIAWLAGIVTDAAGLAEVAIELPRTAGVWRLTARAADSSAAVLVGEVRTDLRAARQVDVLIAAPRLARVGDRIVLPVEVANHGAEAIDAALTCVGVAQTVTIAPRSRRTVPVPWTVPAPATDAPVRRLGGQLGRVIRLQAKLASGAVDAATAESDVLVVPDGLSEHASLMLVAAEDGTVLLPYVIPAGSLVHAEVRAWPDVGARRDEEVLRWRARADACGAMSWLLAPPGAQRRSELAQRWGRLDQSPAAQVVRLASLRLGQGGGGVRELPEGVIGDWLRARARVAGLRLPPPARRAGGTGELSEQVAITGIALAEGWGEGQRLWADLRGGLLASDEALVLALGLDAAQLAGDRPAQAVLAGRLVRAPWSDPFVAVLAAELLPPAGPVRSAGLHLAGAPLEAQAGAVWSEALAAPLTVTAAPGAVLALELRWQAPMATLSEHSAYLPRPVVRVDRGDGFRPLAVGESVLPGERVVLSLEGADADWHALVSPPAGMRIVPEAGEVRLCDPVGWGWRLPVEAVQAMAPVVSAWRGAPAGREQALAAWRAALARATPVRVRDSRKLQATEVVDACGRLQLASGSALLLEAGIEGELRWSPLRLQRGDDVDAVRWLALPAVRIGAGAAVEETAPDDAELLGMLAAAPTCPEELDWLLEQPLLDSQTGRILAPTGQAQLADLLAHPACGRPGHWTERALRRWLDGEPALDGLAETDAVDLIGTLDGLISAVATSRDERRSAAATLPAPQAPARRTPATLRAWYEAAARLVAGTPGWQDWLWEQYLFDGHLTALGYEATLDGWVSFLRREWGVSVRLGSGCFGGEDAPTGDRLGTRELATRGLLLTREKDGGLTLTGIAGRSVDIAMSVDWQDRPFSQALAELNDKLANRGLPPVALAADVDAAALPAVTVRANGLAWRTVLGHLATLSGLAVEGHRLERVQP